MAFTDRPERPVLEGAAGFVAKDDKVPTYVLRSMWQALQRAVEALSGRLGLGTGAHTTHSGRIDGQWLRFTILRDEVLGIPHGLGRVPIGYFVAETDQPDFAAFRDPNHDWSAEMIWLKGSANVNLNLLILLV
jgi:hypothetical protein